MRVFFLLLVTVLSVSTFAFAAKVAKPVETFFLDRIWLQPFERTLDETERLNRLLNPLGMSFNPGILRSNRPPNTPFNELVPHVTIGEGLQYGEAFQLLQSMKQEFDFLVPLSKEFSDDDVFLAVEDPIHSVRTYVGLGEQATIVGFTIPEGPSRFFMARAKGQVLENFGVENSLKDTSLSLFTAGGKFVLSNNDGSDLSNWEKQMALPLFIAEYFDLIDREGGNQFVQNEILDTLFGNEGVIVTILDPGNYGLFVSGEDGGTGVALIEYVVGSRSFLELSEIDFPPVIEDGSVGE